MLTKIVEISTQRIEIESRKAREDLQSEIVAIKANFNARGMLHSGGTLATIARACAEAAERRADMAWSILHRTVTSIGSPDNREELRNQLRGILTTVMDGVTQEITGTTRGAVGALANQRMIAECLEIATSGARTGLARSLNEVEIFMASLDAPRNNGAGVVLNAYGPIGAIQTGSDAVANVSHAWDAAVLAALQDRLRELQTRLPPGTPDREQIQRGG